MAQWHSLGWSPAVTAEIEQEINVQRLTTLLRNQPVTAAAHIVNSLTLTIFALTQGAKLGSVVFAMQAGLLLAAALQFRTWFKNRHRTIPETVSDRPATRAVVYALIFGALWGFFVAALLVARISPGVDLIACIVAAGMMAGGVTMLFMIPAAAAAFIVGIVPAPLTAFFLRDDSFAALVAMYSAIYAACLTAAARTWYSGFVTGVTLRMKNADLAAKAESASRAKSRFLANMSHELRTPLNAIVGFAEMIDRQFHGPVGNPQYLEFARAIRDGGAHLGAVIDDILDLSKIEAGAVDLAEDSVDMIALVDEALLLVRPAIAKTGVKVTTLHEPIPISLIADARRLRQCLVNVLSNAIKFTPNGGAIRVETRRATGGGVLILIGDTGIGIDQADLSEIVKPFVQGRNAERQRHRGAGLGLSIAEQLLQLHGGRLAISSTPGEGTVVALWLPQNRIVEQRLQAAG